MDIGSLGTSLPQAAHAAPDAAAWDQPGVAAEGESPIAHADNGLRAANAQTFARPHAPVIDPLRPSDTVLPSAANAESDFAIPADQLVPATLTGLQVEPAMSWPLLRHGFDRAATEADDEREARDDPPRGHAEPDDHDEPAAAKPLPDADDAPDASGCEPLTRALRRALAARVVPQALLLAAEQWRQGRCVVLACPQGDDPSGPAWAFVLWPRGGSTQARGHASMPASGRSNMQPGAGSSASADDRLPTPLFGLRVEARLQWSTPPRGAQWCHVRVIKEHHPQRGRQLIALGDAALPACAVQLGPVLARSLRWCEVCVHVNAVRRFWAALGGQWSVNVVVSSQPLAALPAAHPETM